MILSVYVPYELLLYTIKCEVVLSFEVKRDTFSEQEVLTSVFVNLTYCN